MTGAHHHYMGRTCAERGRTCTDDRCADMVAWGLLELCADECAGDELDRLAAEAPRPPT